MVHIQEEVAILGRQARIHQILVISGGHQRVQGVVLLGHRAVGLGIPENRFLGVLVHFFKLQSVFHGNVSFFEFLLDESVSRVQVLHKSIIGVNHSERAEGRHLAVRKVPIVNHFG